MPWYDEQLNYTALSKINQGRYVSAGDAGGRRFAAGAPVTVALIDSGLNPDDAGGKPNPVFEGADLAPTHQIRRWQYDDCVGHGTSVASLIVGQPGASLLVGIAPRVHVVPIQYTNVEKGGTAADLAAALSYALDTVHPRVINMSLQLPNRPGPQIMALLRQAEREHVVIVAAGGNDDGQGNGAVYPAALSGALDNIIAVSAVGRDGVRADFGVSGHYIDVAAPGDDVPVAESYGGAVNARGTSFAAPLVTGTAALLLATHPDMTPLEVRDRLEATADPPPGKQPDSQYGWGEIDPLQAITSVRDDLVSPPTPAPGPPLAAPQAVAPPSRTLEHHALAVAVVLLGLAALAVTGAAVLRGSRRTQARSG